MRGLISILTILTVVLTATSVLAIGPDTLWTRHLGTSAADYGYCVQQTSDGGFIVAGMSTRDGNPDVYLLKTDANGDSLWDRTYGGTEEDYAYGIDVCSDGGFIVTGYTGNWITGDAQVYVIRTDANGDSIWTRAYGSPGSDRGNSVIETDVGGFLVVGTEYVGGVGYQIYMIKIDDDGDVAWSQLHKAYANTLGYEVQEMTFGGQYYAVAASCQWKVGGYEAFLVKTDELGDTLWTSSYGTVTGYEYAESFDLTSDGGYILAGHATGFSGTWDGYVVKADALGDSVWQRALGGALEEYMYAVRETPDGNYVVVGQTQGGVHGHVDIYVVKLDAFGDTLWTGMYGTAQIDYGYDLRITSDGGLIIVGYGRDPVYHSYDVYLVRTGPDASVDPREPGSDLRVVKASPNPFSTSVRISYILSAPARVSADVFDIRGRRVSGLLGGASQGAGCRSLTWDGTDSNGTRMPPGIYFLRLRAGSTSAVEKIVLVE